MFFADEVKLNSASFEVKFLQQIWQIWTQDSSVTENFFVFRCLGPLVGKVKDFQVEAIGTVLLFCASTVTILYSLIQCFGSGSNWPWVS